MRQGVTKYVFETLGDPAERVVGPALESLLQITEVSRELRRRPAASCRVQLGIGETDKANLRLEALFVQAITLGLRPGELRLLTWEHVDVSGGVVHVGRGASKAGDTKTAKSKRSRREQRNYMTAAVMSRRAAPSAGRAPRAPSHPANAAATARRSPVDRRTI